MLLVLLFQININSIKKCMKSTTCVDTEVVPFGRLERESLTNAVSSLEQIKLVLIDKQFFMLSLITNLLNVSEVYN